MSRAVKTCVLAGFLASAAVLAASEDGFGLRRWSVEDGLSQSSVYAVLQDRRGFLWLGTEDGLNRFDGYRFETYRAHPEDPTSLSNSHVNALFEDASGTLWAGTFEGRIHRFEPERGGWSVVRGPGPGELSSDYVTDFAEDRQGALWVATLGDGLYRIDPERRDLVVYHHRSADPRSLADDRVLALLADRHGTLWVGSETTLQSFDPAQGLFRRAADEIEGSVYALHEDAAGILWVGGNEGRLWALGPRRGQLETTRCPPWDPEQMPSHRVVAIFDDVDGALRVATSAGGLATVDPAAGSCRRLAAARDLEDDYVLTATPDRAGGVWIGTLESGVLHLYRTYKRFHREGPGEDGSNSLGEAYVFAVHEDHTGTLWVGTEGGGLYARDRGSSSFRQYRAEADNPRSLADNTVWAIHEDRRGDLWIATRQGGLDRFDRESQHFVHYHPREGDPRSLASLHVRSLYEDRSGTLWVGTVGGGLHRYDPEADAFDRFLVDSEEPLRNSVTTILEDRSGGFWIGTLLGLVHFDPRRPGRELQHPPRDPLDRLRRTKVRALHEDDHGLWIGTQGEGLFLFNPRSETYRSFRVEDGLPNNVVYAVLPDDDGRLWLSTNLGLSRFDPASETFRNFDVKDGLPSNEFNAGAAFRGNAGTLYFGGVSGFVSFDPREVRDNPEVPPVVLTDFKLFNMPVEPGTALRDGRVLLGRPLQETRGIRLGYGDRVISFEFAALSYVNPEKNRYAYFLENFDDDWTDAGTRRFATYTNLPPGDYVFRVKGSNNDGVWNEEGTSISLTVDAPFWRRWWFLAASGALVAFVVFSFFRYRTYHITQRALALAELNLELEKKSTDLERFVYTMSHDLRNPLLTIRAFLGSVERDVLSGSIDRFREDTERIRQATDKMSQLLDGLLSISQISHRAKSDDLVALDDVVAGLVERARETTGEDVVFEVEPGLGKVSGDRLLVREVWKQLIDNAVKFRGEAPSRVEIGRAEEEGGWFVRDNGVGIDPRHLRKVFGLFDKLDPATEGTGLGLAVAKRIVEEMGGRIRIESQGLGSGVTVSFTLRPAGATRRR